METYLGLFAPAALPPRRTLRFARGLVFIHLLCFENRSASQTDRPLRSLLLVAHRRCHTPALYKTLVCASNIPEIKLMDCPFRSRPRLRRPVSSRGIGESGHGYNRLLKPAGESAQSHQVGVHHPRFRFIMAPWASGAPSVSSALPHVWGLGIGF